MFVTAQDFNEYPYHLPDFGEYEQEFNLFADKQEREVLPKVFGPLFYNELDEALLLDPMDDWWNELVNGVLYYWGTDAYYYPGLKEVLRGYVYSKWLEFTWMTVTSGGPMLPAFENGEIANPRREIIKGFNAFVRGIGFSPYSPHYKFGVYGTVYDYLTNRNQMWPYFANWRHVDLVPMNLLDL